MRQRHRIPSIFNLSMVDVLCCALGCVILLWLLNLRQAKQSGRELTRAQLALADKSREAEDIYGKLRLAEKERDELRVLLTASKAHLADVEAEAAGLRQRRTALEADLGRRGKDLADLAARLDKKEAEARDNARTVRDLEDRLRDKDLLVRKSRLRADALDLRAARLEKDLAGTGKAMQDLDALRIKLVRDLASRDRDLDAARQQLVRLDDDKRALAKQAGRLKGEMESRFAGIALTGRKVVFLVDMSGSMELVDPRTSAPNKWLGVRETLARVMRSLPGLEKFQVILFSDKVLYPLRTPLPQGERGTKGGTEWLDYDGPASVDRVVQALADPKFKPKGGTNMYAAFEAAFRFRPAGLDTIYLFSDGLPNQGRGITAEQAAKLGEIDKGELLGKYIRRTLAADWNAAVDGRRVRINAVGFFYESPDVGAFLWALARENDGSFVGMSQP